MDKNRELADGKMEYQEDPSSVGENGGGDDNEEESLVIKLKKPYLFEQKEYTEINLTGLDELKASDMIALEKQYDRRAPGINVMPEVKVEYAVMMAARAAKLPVEFFDGLPPKEVMKVKNRIMGFLFGSD